MADWTWKAGDTTPYTYSCENEDGTTPYLAGATVRLLVRSLAQPLPLTIAGTVAVTSPTAATITYTPAVADTATPGQYQASFVATLENGTVATYPPAGYLWFSIEESLASAPQQLVSLDECKALIGIPASDRQHDAKLTALIHAIRPVIENQTGPIIVQEYDEWYDGGNLYVKLRHPPSTAPGTTPVLNLMACSEYIVGVPVEWSLVIVGSPDEGQMYSCQLDMRRGRVIRRTAGGAIQPFPPGPNTVHAVYQAGQAVVPENVRDAALELVRVNYETTMPVGHGMQTVADTQDSGPQLKVGMPHYVRMMLGPTRRHPAFA